MGIADTIAELERLRKKTQKTDYSMLFLGVGVSLFIIGAMNGLPLLVMLGVLVIAYTFIVGLFVNDIDAARRQYNELYRKTFTEKVLSESFDKLECDWEFGFPSMQIKSMGLAKPSNSYHSDNYFRGYYNDVLFEHAEVIIEFTMITHRDDDAHISSATFFDGRMFTIQYPDIQTIGLQVYTKEYGYAEAAPNGAYLQEVAIGDEHFSKDFIVRAINPDDVNLLSASLMARIQELKTRYNSFVLYFANGKLHIGVQGKRNMFNPPLDKEISYPTEHARVKRNVEEITFILDTMTQSSVM